MKDDTLLHQTDEFVAGLLTEEKTELLRLLNKLRAPE